MVSYEFQRAASILIVIPQGPLEAADFERLAREVDPYIAEKGQLAGLMIHVKSFPGWRDFAGFRAHVRFVRAHHRKIVRLAAVTDSGFASVALCIGRCFVRPQLKRFRYQEKEAALAWLRSASR